MKEFFYELTLPNGKTLVLSERRFNQLYIAVHDTFAQAKFLGRIDSGEPETAKPNSAALIGK